MASVRVQTVEVLAGQIDDEVNRAIEALENQGHRIREVQLHPSHDVAGVSVTRAVVVYEILEEPTPPFIG